MALGGSSSGESFHRVQASTWLAKSKSGNGYSSTALAFWASSERRLLLAAGGGVGTRKHQERGRHVKIQLDGLIMSFGRRRSRLYQLLRHRKLLDHSFGQQLPGVFQRDVAGRKIGDQGQDCLIAPD